MALSRVESHVGMNGLDSFIKALPPRAPLPVPHVHHARDMPRCRMIIKIAVPHAAATTDVRQQYETLEVMPEEAIQDLKLRMLNRGFNRPPGTGCLVFGDLDEGTRTDLLSASSGSGSDWLHIFAPAAAVESVSVRTPKEEFCLNSSFDGVATGAEASAIGAGPLPLLLAAPWPSAAAASPPNGAAAQPPAVLHLLVHKSARVAWRHMANDTYELSISSPDTTKDLMRKVEDATGLSLRDGQNQLVYGEQILEAGQPLASYGIHKGDILKLLPVEPPSCDDVDGSGAAGDLFPDGSPRLASPLHELHGHWKRARAGLAEGHAPRLAPAGTGGCYFLRDEQGNPVAVFKPEDEEPLAANNPKGRAAPHPIATAPFAGIWAVDSLSAAAGGEGAIVGGAGPIPSEAALPGEGLRRGLRPGEGAVREVAAYVLDHGHFSGVPATAMVQLEVGGAADGSGAAAPPCAKVGSLQQYVSAEFDCEERGVSEFPPSEVHKIAVLDLRLGNTDRNGGNILARRRPVRAGENPAAARWELVPIDHGSCLPDKFEDLSFEWQWWPQADMPFDEATKAYIASLDAEKDVAALAAHGLAIRPECLRVLRVCTMLLTKAAAAGLTASQIAGLASRQALTKSPLEKMHAVAAALATAGAQWGGDGGSGGAPAVAAAATKAAVVAGRFDEGVYLKRMGQLMDELLEDFVLDNGGQLLL